MTSRRSVLKAALLAGCSGPMLTKFAFAAAPGNSLVITTTGVMTTQNPYAHSSVSLYYIWSQVFGSLIRYDYLNERFEGVLAEKWETVNPTTWRFTLRKDLKRQDGGPGPSSQDVVHSWTRVMKDPQSLQRFYMSEVEKIVVVDDTSFDVVTKRPVAQLLSFLADRFVITSAELYNADPTQADRKTPIGWGPYTLERFDVDQMVVLKRNDAWPKTVKGTPVSVVFKMTLEAEQRVTALANNEVQIARQIAPQLVPRLKKIAGVELAESGATEYMFLGMDCSKPPFNDVRVRQAVAHCVNRQLIIDRLLFKLADPMVGALGRYHHAFPPPQDGPKYDPKAARALLAEAGHPNGLDIDFYTANGRYISDRQIADAIAQMLKLGGFNVKVHTPDYANFVAMVRDGACPIYYTGRATTNESLEALTQFFETGVSKRIQYSNPDLDAAFVRLRATFDEPGQVALLHEISNLLARDVPAVFLWTHRFVHGLRNTVKWTPDATGEVWLPVVTVA